MRLRPTLFALCCIAALAGCDPPPNTAAQTCGVERVAAIPLVYAGGFLVVPGGLDGHQVPLMLDTGSEQSTVTPAAVSSLQLDRDPLRRTTIHGIGGEVGNLNVRLVSFGVGPLRFVDPSLAVGPVPQVPGLRQPLAGVLGEDFLADYDLDLDPPRHSLTLFRVRDCGAGFTPWQNAAPPLKLHRPEKGLTAIHLEVDGQTVSALVDSGARGSLVTLEAARRLGVTDDALAADPAVRDYGVGQTILPGHIHRFAEIRIGRQVFRNQPMVVVDTSIRGADILLGADFLHTRHVWLSSAADKMFFAPPGM